MLQITGRDLVQGDTPRNPPKATALHGDIMEHKAKINHAKRRKVREHRIEVRLSDDELAQLKNANASSIARLLRESALRAVNKQEMEVPQFTKLDRDFLLELSRIGNNINQLAHAVNRDLASDRPLDAARLLYLLVGVEQALKELRDDR
jgi:hypothetical protein